MKTTHCREDRRTKVASRRVPGNAQDLRVLQCACSLTNVALAVTLFLEDSTESWMFCDAYQCSVYYISGGSLIYKVKI